MRRRFVSAMASAIFFESIAISRSIPEMGLVKPLNHRPRAPRGVAPARVTGWPLPSSRPRCPMSGSSPWE